MKLLGWIVLLFIVNQAIAQNDTTNYTVSCHCIRNLTPSGVMISHVHPKSEWMVSYRFTQMNMGKPSSTSSDIYNQYLMYTPSMRMNMHMLMAMVGITDRITLMGMFHYMQNSMPMEMMSAHTHSMSGMTMSANSSMEMNTSGLGDTKLFALYGLIKTDNQQLVVSNGVNIPTGNVSLQGTSTDMLYEGKRYPYMMQLGSGSWEYLPNITYVYQKEDVAVSYQTAGIIRLNNNVNGYRLGNEWYNTAWIGYNWWDNIGSTLRLEGTLSEKIHGQDQQVYTYNELGANPANYGGTRLSAFVGTSYELDLGSLTGCRIALEYGIPFYQKLNGIQNKATSTWNASLNFSF